MIIDSHAHYNNSAYKKPFRYLSYDKNGYSLKEDELPQLMQEMEAANIRYFIEPGVSLQSCEEVLQLCAEYSGRIFPAIGVHPTRSIFEKWSDRHKLAAYANTPGVIAIGEIGLDYHYDEPDPEIQKVWFERQLLLAKKLDIPYIIKNKGYILPWYFSFLAKHNNKTHKNHLYLYIFVLILQVFPPLCLGKN